MTLVFGFFILSSMASHALGQAAAIPADIQASASKLVKLHEAWGPEANPPHTSLSLKEISREGPVIRFRLYETGLPKDGVYTLLQWPVTQGEPSPVMRGVTFDKTGLAICAGTAGTCGKPDKPNDPINLALQPVPGEPSRLALISSDQALKVYAKIVAIPQKGEDKGCSVEATLLTPGAELVVIEATGFPANADIVMDSDSEGDRHEARGKTDANGRYVSALLPFKKGVDRGTAKVTMTGAACSPSVSFPWGRRNP